MTKKKEYNIPDWVIKIEFWGACPQALNWLKKNKFKNAQQAWNNCKDSEWMAWLIDRSLHRKGIESYDVEIEIFSNFGDNSPIYWLHHLEPEDIRLICPLVPI